MISFTRPVSGVHFSVGGDDNWFLPFSAVVEFVSKSIRVISYATLVYRFDRGDVFKPSYVLLVFGSYYSYRYGVSVRILIPGFLFHDLACYFECLLLCILYTVATICFGCT